MAERTPVLFCTVQRSIRRVLGCRTVLSTARVNLRLLLRGSSLVQGKPLRGCGGTWLQATYFGCRSARCLNRPIIRYPETPEPAPIQLPIPIRTPCFLHFMAQAFDGTLTARMGRSTTWMPSLRLQRLAHRRHSRTQMQFVILPKCSELTALPLLQLRRCFHSHGYEHRHPRQTTNCNVGGSHCQWILHDFWY